MLTAYEAVLRGDTLEWKDAAPTVAHDEARTVYILFPAAPLGEEGTAFYERGKRMAEALRSIAAVKDAPSISNPSEWQREQRQERPLPGRDEQVV